MADKSKTNFPLPQDTDSSFEEENFLLNYRPRIEFVEPDQEIYEIPYEEPKETIDSFRDRTEKLINGLSAAAKLMDATQKRIDQRVNSGGGVTVKLDPKRDAVTIAAMKRRFPDKEDPTQITYDDYKAVLDCIEKSAADPIAVSAADLQAAQSNSLKTDFGGYGNQNGENRPEISSSANAMEPLDLDLFQKGAVLALFAMMLPLIKIEDKKEIVEHMVTSKHF